MYEIITFSNTMLHFVLFHNVTCYTNSLLSHIHVNTIKVRNITCTLVATCLILRSLECTIWVSMIFGCCEYLKTYCFLYHSGLYTMQEPSCIDKITLVPIWFKMVLTQTTTQIYKDLHTLRYPLHINIKLELQFWYTYVGSWIPLLMSISSIRKSNGLMTTNV